MPAVAGRVIVQVAVAPALMMVWKDAALLAIWIVPAVVPSTPAEIPVSLMMPVEL